MSTFTGFNSLIFSSVSSLACLTCLSKLRIAKVCNRTKINMNRSIVERTPPKVKYTSVSSRNDKRFKFRPSSDTFETLNSA